MWVVTVLVMATWAAVDSTARYEDYSNVKMPQYGGNDYDSPRDAAGRFPSDDYQGHVVDAPASLDYKYEEDRREENIKSEEPLKAPENTEMWSKIRKHRGTRPPEDSKDSRDKYSLDVDTVSKFKSNHRNMKHRSRLKGRNSKRDENAPRVELRSYGRDRDNIYRKEYLHMDKEFGVDKTKHEEDDKISYVRKHTTERVIRRKVRDRYVKGPPELERELEELAASRRMKADDQDYDYKLDNENTKHFSESPARDPIDRFRPVVDEEEEHAPPTPTRRSQAKLKDKNYDEYGEYYDMKRVHNIKNQLPVLLRRSTVRESPPSLSSELMDLFRRAFSTSTETTTTTTSRVTSTAVITTSETETEAEVVSSVATNVKNSEKISFAEKSRLSILRKAQRKESARKVTTKKPPVLLQVTQKMATVVMLAPGSSQQPWMRAQQLAENSPETIKQVKLLMRKKLVAQARSIDEIAEGWDEMICDYVDVSQIPIGLSRAGVNHASIVFTIATVLVVQ